MDVLFEIVVFLVLSLLEIPLAMIIGSSAAP
jgi:hypothetical protein